MKKLLCALLLLCLVLPLLSACGGGQGFPFLPQPSPAAPGQTTPSAPPAAETLRPAPSAQTLPPAPGAEPSPAAGEEIVLPPPEEAPALRAYLDLLEQDRSDILLYTWQHGYYGYGAQTDEELPRPVVFCDVWGDELPEMIYLKCSGSEWSTSLNIVTWDKGRLRSLFSETWDVLVAGGFRYYLYQLAGERSLYAFTSSGDESWTRAYLAFVPDDAGDLSRQTLLKDYDHPGSTEETYSQRFRDCSLNGLPVSEEEYELAEEQIRAGTSAILMFSAGVGDYAPAFVAAHGCPAMSCDEAVAWLRERLGLADQPEEGYVAAAADLSPEAVETLSGLIGDVIARNVAESWAPAEHLDASRFLGCYVLSRKEGSSGPRNYVIAVCRNDVTISIPRENLSKSLSYYYTLRWTDVKLADGQLILGGYETPSGRVLAGIPGHNFYYDGYEDISVLLSSLVQPYTPAYTLTALGDFSA